MTFVNNRPFLHTRPTAVFWCVWMPKKSLRSSASRWVAGSFLDSASASACDGPRGGASAHTHTQKRQDGSVQAPGARGMLAALWTCLMDKACTAHTGCWLTQHPCVVAFQSPSIDATRDIVSSYQKSYRGQLINRRMAWAMRWVVRSPSVRLTDQKAGLPLLKPRNQV